jgi:hypothetical protein
MAINNSLVIDLTYSQLVMDKSSLNPASNPDVVLSRALAHRFVAGVQNAPRFDQQQLHFVLGIRLVLDALGNDIHLAFGNRFYFEAFISKPLFRSLGDLVAEMAGLMIAAELAQ